MKAYYSIHHLFSILSVKDSYFPKDKFLLKIPLFLPHRSISLKESLKDLKIFERWNWGALKATLVVHPLICDQKQCFLFFWNLMLLNDQFFPLAQPQKTSTIIRIFTRHERGFTTWRKSCFSHFFLNTRFICAWSNIMLMCVSTHSFSEKTFLKVLPA